MADCKLTPEIAKVIYKNLKNGATFETAAQAVGISRQTLHNWMQRGEKGEPDFLLFLQTIKELRAEVELELNNVLWDASKKNPEIAKWLLAHMNRDAWGDRQEIKMEHTGNIDNKIEFVLIDDTSKSNKPNKMAEPDKQEN